MQFQVPQFIETEDKIIGPLTLKQFLYIAAAGGLSFICFFFLKTWLWLIITMILGTAGAALAFIKINGRPLPKVLIAALGYYWKPRLYLWKRADATEESEPRSEDQEKPKSFLDSLKQQITTSRDPIPKREKTAKRPILERVKGKGRFEMMRKITGEKEKARKVDYK